MKKLTLIIVLSLICSTIFSQTYHSGQITSNETWTTGTHIVTATVTVLDGVTLVIEPDCTVKFEDETSLSINGRLVADGSDDHRINFTSNEIVSAPGDWRYIYFGAADPNCLMDYCEIEYGGYQYGNIHVHASGTNVVISNTTTRYSGTAGVFINDQNASVSTPTFTNCTFYNNTNYGLNCSPGYSDVVLTDCSFEDNGSYALNLYGNSITNISGSLNLSGNGVDAILVNEDGNIETGTWADWGYGP